MAFFTDFDEANLEWIARRRKEEEEKLAAATSAPALVAPPELPVTEEEGFATPEEAVGLKLPEVQDEGFATPEEAVGLKPPELPIVPGGLPEIKAEDFATPEEAVGLKSPIIAPEEKPSEVSRAEEFAYRIKRGARTATEELKAGTRQMASGFLSAEQNPYLEKSTDEAKADVSVLEKQIEETEKSLIASGGHPELVGQEWYFAGDLTPDQREHSQKLGALQRQLGFAKETATGKTTESFAGALSRSFADVAADNRLRRAEILKEYEGVISKARDKEFWMNVADSIGSSAPSMGASMLNPAFGLALMYSQTFETSRSEFLEKGGDPAKADEYAHTQATLQTPWEVFGELPIANLAKGTIKRLIGKGDPQAWASWIKARAVDLSKAVIGEREITTPMQVRLEQKSGEEYGVKPPMTEEELQAEVRRQQDIATAQTLLLGGGPVVGEAGYRAATMRGAPEAAPVAQPTTPAEPPPIPPTPPEEFAPRVEAPGVVPGAEPGVVTMGPPEAPPTALGAPPAPPLEGIIPPPVPGEERFAPPGAPPIGIDVGRADIVATEPGATDPAARFDLVDKIQETITSGKPLGYGKQGDGTVTVGYEASIDSQVKVKLTPDERMALTAAEADLELSDTPEERAQAHAAIQAVLVPVVTRRLTGVDTFATPSPAGPVSAPVEPGAPTPAGQAATGYVAKENVRVQQVADTQSQNLQAAGAPKTAQAIQQVAARSNEEASVTAEEFLAQAKAQQAEAQAEAQAKAQEEAAKTAGVRPEAAAAPAEAPVAAAARPFGVPPPIPGAAPIPGAVQPGEFPQKGYTAQAPAAAPAPVPAAPAAPAAERAAVVVGGQVFTGETHADASAVAFQAVGPDAMRSMSTGWVDPNTGRFVSHEVIDAYQAFNSVMKQAGGNVEHPAVADAQAQLAEAVARDDELNNQIVQPGGEQVVGTGVKGQEAVVSVRPSQELAVPLAGVTVNIEGVTPEGRRTTVQQPAAQALNDARNDRTAYQILLDCLH